MRLGLAPLLVLAVVSLDAMPAFAQAPPVALRYEVESKQVVQGEPFELNIVLSTTQERVDELALPNLAGLTILRESRSQSTQVQIRGGKRVTLNEQRYAYILRADEPGRLVIGEGMARVGSATARAAPLVLEVIGSDDPPPRTQQAEADARVGARFGKSPPPAFVEVTVDKETAFVGEQVTGTTELYSQQPLSQWPRVPGLKPQGFLCVSLLGDDRPQPTQRTVAGRTYYVYLLNKDALFPLQSGTLTVPALQVDVVPSGSMFARGRPLGARSLARPITVKPLPDAGQPARFASGNVGVFELEVSARPQSSPMGQPFTLTIAATGRGLLERIELPTWDGGNVARVFPPTKKIERAVSDEVVAGRVVTEMLVQPAREGTLTIPALSLWVYNPEANGGTGGYVEARSKPIAISVRAPRGGAVAGTDAAPASGRQLVARGARPLKARVTATEAASAAVRELPVLFGALVALGGAAAAIARRVTDRRRGAPQGKRAEARKQRAQRLDDAAQRGDLASLEAVLLDVLAERFGPSVKSDTTAALEDFLIGKGQSAADAKECAALIREIEGLRYAPGATAERTRVAQAVRALALKLEDAA